MSNKWQIFQDIMVGLACGSQPGIQGLPMLVMYEKQKKELEKLEEIGQAMQSDEIPYVYPVEEE